MRKNRRSLTGSRPSQPSCSHSRVRQRLGDDVVHVEREQAATERLVPRGPGVPCQHDPLRVDGTGGRGQGDPVVDLDGADRRQLEQVDAPRHEVVGEAADQLGRVLGRRHGVLEPARQPRRGDAAAQLLAAELLVHLVPERGGGVEVAPDPAIVGGVGRDVQEGHLVEVAVDGIRLDVVDDVAHRLDRVPVDGPAHVGPQLQQRAGRVAHPVREHAGVATGRAVADVVGLEDGDAGVGSPVQQVLGRPEAGEPAADDGHVIARARLDRPADAAGRRADVPERDRAEPHRGGLAQVEGRRHVAAALISSMTRLESASCTKE